MISRITKPRVIRKFKTYDFEWVPGTLQIRLCGVYDGEEYRCYRTVEDFLNGELTHTNRGLWYYAHAGGLADIQFVLEQLLKRIKRNSRWSIRGCFSSSSTIITRIGDGHSTFTFIDSYWLLRDKLKNIAKSLGMEKGAGTGYPGGLLDPDDETISDEEHYRRRRLIREWYATCPFAELRDYNEQDCIILWEAIDRFESELLSLGGQLQMTVASCGMQLIRRKYLKRDIQTSERINHPAREAYFASRVEDLALDAINFNYYDINSSFPSSMTYPLPGEYVATVNTLPETGVLYIARVDIEVKDSYLPPTPFRHMGRVFFPFGRWTAWLTSIDIEALIERGGTIHRVYEAIIFREFTDLREYVHDIYSLRAETKDPFKKIVYKYMLNAPYGKFAESPWKQGFVINPQHRTRNMVEYEPGVFLEDKRIPVPHVHVPISAHIVARSRLLLLSLGEQCQDLYYWDTDGLATDTELETDPKILGKLKLEKLGVEGHFYAPKNYSIRGSELKDGEWKEINMRKLKGFSGIRAGNYARILEGEAIEHERMRRVKELIREEGVFRPREDTILKRVRVLNPFDPRFDDADYPIPEGFISVGLGGGNSYPKRFQYPDGSTRPWHVDEIRKNIRR